MNFIIKRMEDNKKYPPGEYSRSITWAIGTYEPYSDTVADAHGYQRVNTSYHFKPLIVFKTVVGASTMLNYLNGGPEPNGGLAYFLAENLA